MDLVRALIRTLGFKYRTLTTFEKTTEEVSKYNQIIKDNSSKVSLIASAMKEMADDGHISASTYAELVEKGGNFTECLEVQNGKLVLNIDIVAQPLCLAN